MKLGAIVVLFLAAILAAQAADSKLTFEAAW